MNEHMPLESITPSESPTMVQASCHQSNQDDCRQSLLGYLKQQTQLKTPDPD
jgi:hypothetical protein